MAWFLYLIECEGNSIYTGITVDVERRFQQHLHGKGARYTRANIPKRLLAIFEFPDRSSALKAEYAMKRCTAQEKRSFCGIDTNSYS